MPIGRGIMNIGRANVVPTLTQLNVDPNNLLCGETAYFRVTVQRENLDMPYPSGNVRIINIDLGDEITSGVLSDGYFSDSMPLESGVYNFQAIYDGLINQYAESQSAIVSFLVGFKSTSIRLVGLSSFPISSGAIYEAEITVVDAPEPVSINNGDVLFIISDGYTSDILGVMPVLNNFAYLEIEPNTIPTGNWILSAQYFSGGICYASSEIDLLEVMIT